MTFFSFLRYSVLESDPQFGFEEAKRKLEGRDAQGGLMWDSARQGRWWRGGSRWGSTPWGCERVGEGDCLWQGVADRIPVPPERPWLVDCYDTWLQRLKVHAAACLGPQAAGSRGHGVGGGVQGGNLSASQTWAVCRGPLRAPRLHPQLQV